MIRLLKGIVLYIIFVAICPVVLLLEFLVLPFCYDSWLLRLLKEQTIYKMRKQ